MQSANNDNTWRVLNFTGFLYLFCYEIDDVTLLMMRGVVMGMMMMMIAMLCPSLLLQVIGADVVFALDVVQLVLLLVHVDALERLVRLVVEHDQIAVADVEAGQMVAGVLRVEDVLVDDECCAARLRCVATASVCV